MVRRTTATEKRMADRGGPGETPTSKQLVFIVGISDKWFLLPKAGLRGDCDFGIRVSKAGHGNDEVWKGWKAKKLAFQPSPTPWQGNLLIELCKKHRSNSHEIPF
jgi:hypothetical protein